MSKEFSEPEEEQRKYSLGTQNLILSSLMLKMLKHIIGVSNRKQIYYMKQILIQPFQRLTTMLLNVVYKSSSAIISVTIVSDKNNFVIECIPELGFV